MSLTLVSTLPPVVVREVDCVAREEEKETFEDRESSLRFGPQAPKAALFRSSKRFGGFVVNGRVHVSNLLLFVCLFEAILWASLCFNSHAGVNSSDFRSESAQFLLRETHNVEKTHNYKGIRTNPYFKSLQSDLVKQHAIYERLWAQRLRSTSGTCSKLEENQKSRRNTSSHTCGNSVLLEASTKGKGIPGPFAGVSALH